MRNHRRAADWAVVAAALLLLAWGATGPAGARTPGPPPGKALITDLDFDACALFEARGPVMEVDPASETIVVAEKLIRPMDLVSGGRRIRTAYLDTDGKPRGDSLFSPGQYVWVKGWAHPDGFVAAAAVQLLAAPPEEKPRLSASKPATKRERKLARRAVRIPISDGGIRNY